MQAKIKAAKKAALGGNDEEVDSDDDSEDPEYEENAGEFSLYDSPLENTDELI